MRILLRFASSKLLVALAAALLIGSTIQAQQVAVALPGQRVLGARYLGVDGGVIDASVFNERGTNLGIDFNFPVTPTLDLAARYGRGWIEESRIGLEDSTFSAAAVVHSAGTGARPFAGVSLGHQQMEMTVGSFREKDSSGIWGGGVGIELPVGAGTITPSVAYTDSFDDTTERTIHLTLHGNYWFTPKFAGYIDVTYADFGDEAEDAWLYRVGLRLKF